jgi:hypothetical protein
MTVRIIKTDARGNEVFPDWLIAVTPGASEAKAAWEAEKSKKMPELSATLQKAIKAAVGLGRWQGTGPADAFYTKRPEVSTATFDEAETAKREAQAAVDKESRRVAALHQRFEELMKRGGAGDPVERRRQIANFALAKNKEVAAAWDTLEQAMDAREQAYHALGAPGRSWDNTGGVADPSNKLALMKHVMTGFIDGFDTYSVALVQDGQNVEHERTPDGDEIRTFTKR